VRVPDDAGRTPSVRNRPAALDENFEDETAPAARPWTAPETRDDWRVEPSPQRPSAEPVPGDDREADRQAFPEPPQAPKSRHWRWLIAAIIAVIIIAGASYFGWYWYTTLRWLETTDDSYTAADMTVIAPQVAGYVDKLFVTDNEHVKAGQMLVRIDPRDYAAAVAKAEANVNSAEADIRNIDAKIALQKSVIAQSRADVAAAEANLTFARQENTRFQELAQRGYATVQRAQQAQADLLAKQAALQHDQGAVEAATRQLDVLNTERDKAQAALRSASAALEAARLDLSRTDIHSPIDGGVGDLAVRVGQYVQPGTRLMTIVPLGSRIYVVANFKETQIERMFRGEQVDITADAFPDVHLHGTVASLAPGSGAQFALLPPENATGNFTKIVQRVPVRIELHDDGSPVFRQLRPGLSVTTTVDTRTAPPPGALGLFPTTGAE
jgi:membrane fusion protein (multidrug efflux system)